LKGSFGESTPPFLRLRGADLAKKGDYDKDSYKKLATAIRDFKKEVFGDEDSKKPYVVFIDEADQASSETARLLGTDLLENWKSFTETGESQAGIMDDVQDNNSIIILATNKFKGIADPIKSRFRNHLNFSWTPQIFKNYGEKRFKIEWPPNKEWDFDNNYSELYSLTSQVNNDLAEELFRKMRWFIQEFKALEQKPNQRENWSKKWGKKPTGILITTIQKITVRFLGEIISYQHFSLVDKFWRILYQSFTKFFLTVNFS